MSKIEIFGSPLSQPTRAVVWLLKALGVDFTFQRIRAGDQFQAEFQKMNPLSKFPVLKEGKFVLDESHSILKYLCRRERSYLYPVNSFMEAAMVDKWLDWKHTYLRPGACGIVRRRVMTKFITDKSKHSMFTDFEEVSPQREVRLLIESLNILENHLSQNTFLAGSTVSIADMALVTELDQLRLSYASGDHEFQISKWKKVHNWLEEVKKTVPGYEESVKAFSEVERKLKSNL